MNLPSFEEVNHNPGREFCVTSLSTIHFSLLYFNKEIMMPISRSITDLIKKTQEILELCKRNNEPVFLKDDGRDELVIMSRDYFNRLWSLLITLEEEQMIEKGIARQSFHVSSLEELYRKLDEAKEAIQKGDVYTHNKVIARLKDR